jgi:hypothetical protein
MDFTRFARSLAGVFRPPIAGRPAGQRKAATTARKRSGKRLKRFAFDPSGDPLADIREKYGYDGDLSRIFHNHRDAITHKWHHYIPLYDRYLARFRGTAVRFLEIGVNRGGSLGMWREYLGAQATLFGVDINPDCARYDGCAGQVRIGSQADPAFLAQVVTEMGGVDVVLDDGSHEMGHVQCSLETLFPLLGDGGLYLIEDLHTSFWSHFGGDYHSDDNFFRYLTRLILDQHHWYHDEPLFRPGIAAACPGIHVHDSLVVLEKHRVYPPAWS